MTVNMEATLLAQTTTIQVSLSLLFLISLGKKSSDLTQQVRNFANFNLNETYGCVRVFVHACANLRALGKATAAAIVELPCPANVCNGFGLFGVFIVM